MTFIKKKKKNIYSGLLIDFLSQPNCGDPKWVSSFTIDQKRVQFIHHLIQPAAPTTTCAKGK